MQRQRLWQGGFWLGLGMMAAALLPAQTVRSATARERALERQIRALTAEPAVARAHWGIAVATLEGESLLAINAAQLFQPASNAKLFTTAAAMALLGADRRFETRLIGRGSFHGATLQGDLVLVGAGDANFGSSDVPYVSPQLRPTPPPGGPSSPPPSLLDLAAMADQLVATGLSTLDGDVVGDDSIWPYDLYPQDWAVDDTVWGYGAPVSALTLADNQLPLSTQPAATPGLPAAVRLGQSTPYYTVEANVRTVPDATPKDDIAVERLPESRRLRVFGSIPGSASSHTDQVAIADPAEYAAAALKAMLEARGVTVSGAARTSHRASAESRGFLEIAHEPLRPKPAPPQLSHVGSGSGDCGVHEPCEQRTLATHTSPTLGEDVVVTNKTSQNLHAELLLRQLGAALGDDGTAAQGARVVRSFLTKQAGLDPEDFVFYDGSGLSGHDLVTPRATTKLLTWAAGQPWFPAWKASLPVGGQDGSLAGRFTTAPLQGHVVAKTGTLGEARALSGYLLCADGRTVAFSIFVGNHLPGMAADREVMDRIVAAIYAAE